MPKKTDFILLKIYLIDNRCYRIDYHYSAKILTIFVDNYSIQTMKKLFLLTFIGILCHHFVIAQTLDQSNLPILKITTKNGATIPDEPKILGTLQLINNGNGRVNTPNDTPTGYDGYLGIELRGSTSKDFFPKKPYGFELWADTTGKSQKIAFLGMPEESDWVLNASYNDKTFMRDALTYDISNRMGRYSTRTRYCEITLNGRYDGLYLVMEKIKRDKNRVNISSIKTTDSTGDALTGGYILKIDKVNGSPAWSWKNTIGTPSVLFQVEYPKYADLTSKQLTYIKGWMTTFEKELYANTALDKDAAWRNMIDMDSFIDYFILTELTKNIDGYRLSTYFYKDKDSKDARLKMGPAWDYNLAYGNADYYEGYKTTGWQYQINALASPTGDIYLSPFWWSKLVQDEDFRTKASTRWGELRKSILSTDRINQWVDSTATIIAPAVARNFKRWPGVLGTKVWPNYYVGTTFQDELNFMKDWIRSRCLWLDGQFQSKSLVLGTEAFFEPKQSLTIFPNPISSQSQVKYEVLLKGHVEINLYDLSGKKVHEVVNENQSVGEYQAPFNKLLPQGIYILDYRIGGIPVDRIKVVVQ